MDPVLDVKTDFSDVLITPQPTNVASRKDVKLTTLNSFKYSSQTIACVPIMAANMDTVGTIDVMKELSKKQLFTCLNKFITTAEVAKNIEFLKDHVDEFAFSAGMHPNEIDRLKDLDKMVDFKVICLDVANGYMQKFVTFCATVREAFPDKIIIAGNVCTSEGVCNLIQNGKVDIVKCGIGSGSACTTRIKTGVGYPQMSCIKECSAMAHFHGAKIISDGGITCPGDVAKAFGNGADFVMIGGQFAGHEECPGETIVEDGCAYKLFYGMSSAHAMKQNYSTLQSYRTSEGRHMKIKMKGPINDTVTDFLGGLRSACAYTNHAFLADMIGKLRFIRVNRQYNDSLVRSGSLC